MAERTILITGVCGEIGQALLESLSRDESLQIISLDLNPLPDRLQGRSTHIIGDLLDKSLLSRLDQEFSFDGIYHLAAILSTTAEYQPLLAHQVNTCGTIDLLELASGQSQRLKRSTKFIFPSSIAVYGIPDLATKNQLPPISEGQCTEPRTMYGCSKLYCEKVGAYFSEGYQQLANPVPVRLDFRALRFPGLISAFTVPSGGTSDFGPEMIHAAARGEAYDCFVRPDVRIPFMVMPDAVLALLQLAQAPLESLSRRVYNVTSFSFSANDFRKLAESGFPGARINFRPDPARQAIVDSWPAEIDDSAARIDWGWAPQFGAERACQEYLLENISHRYHS
jgi:threonine 3-dehydrogenase